MKENEPNTDNVVFIDEYPHLMRRREVKQALGQLTLAVNTNPNQLLLFPVQEGMDLPDEPA